MRIPEGLVVVDLLDKQSSDRTQFIVNFMQQHHIQAMLIRPDFYIFGAVEQRQQIGGLIEYFEETMQQYRTSADYALA